MATVTLQVCDLCGDGETRAVETIQFDADGEIEVDVCPQHQGEWHELEARRAKFAEVGRHVGPQERQTPEREGARGNRPRIGQAGERRENTEIREWARQQGIEIADRGRISNELRDRYRRWRWEQDHPTETSDRAAALRPVPLHPRPIPAPPTATRPATPTPPAASERRQFDPSEALAVHSEGTWRR